MTSKTKKTLLIALGAFVALIAILGVAAPKQFHLESSVVINKPVGEVFAYLRDLKNGEQWSPWHKMDPNMAIEYTGADGQVGSAAAWSGNKDVGVGEQETKAIIDNQRIDYELRFKEPMEGVATAYFVTEAVSPAETKVTWGMDNDAKFPGNLICWIMNATGFMEKTFAQGLADLKAVLEAR